jgi:hypothetical protein
VELKELFLGGADCRRNGRQDYRRLEIMRRFRGLCAAPNQELVVNICRAEGMESEPRITPKIGAFG